MRVLIKSTIKKQTVRTRTKNLGIKHVKVGIHYEKATIQKFQMDKLDLEKRY